MPVIEEILREAKAAGASDVHLTAGIPPKMRVNGRLTAMNYSKMLPADTMDILIDVMPEALREKFEEQGGYIFPYSIPGCGRFRINAYRQQGCVAMAIRIVDEEIPGPKELGMPDAVVKLSGKTRGLVLAAGPMGCGKSTTLAAVIDRINDSREAHIITLEDPVEYRHPHKLSVVNQRDIGIDCGSCESAIADALRGDPDVILLDEIKDPDTISAAFDAAETGCLVLATVNAGGTGSALEKLISTFPPYYQQQARAQLSRVLEAVVCQQLLPTAEGQGRVAAFEVLLANKGVRRLILEGKTSQLNAAMQAGGKQGMIAMDDAILRLYIEKKINKEALIRYVQDPEAMALKLAGAGSGRKPERFG